MLLIHGGGAGCAIWFRQMAALRGQFRVIAPDNPVFGLSSRPGYRVPVDEITSGYLRAFMDAMGIEKRPEKREDAGLPVDQCSVAVEGERVEPREVKWRPRLRPNLHLINRMRAFTG